MITYYSKFEDNSLCAFTPNEQAAKRLNYNLSTELPIIQYRNKKYYVLGELPVQVEDYDEIMEAHLDLEKNDRGYTKREPSDYSNSSNLRWKQDAIDWVAHRDKVMEYGLEILNKHARGEKVPTLEEFRENLPKITWTVALD